MKPRLLFISNLFPDESEPYRGLDNATLLHRLKAGFDIRAIALRPSLFGWKGRQPREVDVAFEPIYVPCRYVPKWGSRFNHKLMTADLRAPFQALRSRWPFDVILSSWLYPDSCSVAALADNIPFVSIAQGTDVHEYAENPVRRRAIVTELSRASAIITRSADLAHRLAQAGLPSSRLHPVYNGIDFDRFQPGDKQAARRALGLPPSAAIILFVGNFLPVKNPFLLLRAHARMAGAHLVMVGGGRLETKARALAAELGSANRIVFAGRRSADEVAQFMQAADTLALPSHNEGVPNVILEAFAAGLPVVASRVGGISEVHSRDFLGRLVPAGELDSLAHALRDILGTPPDQDSIRRHALQFSWENAAASYTALLREAIMSSH